MKVLEKILEEKEIEVIKELIEENERCCNKCEGACSSIKNGICNCYDSVLAQAIQKMQDFLESKKHENNDWIPVEERLPKNLEKVLVWYEYFRYGEYNCMYETYGIGWQLDGNWSGDVSGVKARCIAWKPLLEPYRAADKQDWKENMLNTFLAGH